MNEFFFFTPRKKTKNLENKADPANSQFSKRAEFLKMHLIMTSLVCLILKIHLIMTSFVCLILKIHLIMTSLFCLILKMHLIMTSLVCLILKIHFILTSLKDVYNINCHMHPVQLVFFSCNPLCIYDLVINSY